MDNVTRDTRPHSRACGFREHSHGPACSTDCPTCSGLPGVAPLIGDVPTCFRTDPHGPHDACVGIPLDRMSPAAEEALRTLRGELALLPYSPAVQSVTQLLATAEGMAKRLPWHRAAYPRSVSKPQGL